MTKKNEVWDAVVESCGIDDRALTASAARDIGKTVAELRAIAATPEEIRARAGRWRSMYPNARLTHRVLRNRWGELVPPPARYVSPQQDEVTEVLCMHGKTHCLECLSRLRKVLDGQEEAETDDAP